MLGQQDGRVEVIAPETAAVADAYALHAGLHSQAESILPCRVHPTRRGHKLPACEPPPARQARLLAATHNAHHNGGMSDSQDSNLILSETSASLLGRLHELV